MKSFLRWIKRQVLAGKRCLNRSRLGQWILIGWHPTWLEEFARVTRAVEAYDMQGGTTPVHLRYRMSRCFHRLEKGLAMPQRRVGFGAQVLVELFDLLGRWLACGSPDDRVFQWGLQVAAAYLKTLDEDLQRSDLDQESRGRAENLQKKFRGEWEKWRGFLQAPAFQTPFKWIDRKIQLHREPFEALLNSRVSVRQWTTEPVPPEAIEQAVQHALRAPSACNRQPFGIVAVRERKTIEQVGAMLPGGKGFVEQAPLLLAMLTDYGAYEGYHHRRVAFSDGGMAAMLFLLSLTVQGYGTVCLNWAVEVEKDQLARQILGIRDSEAIMFFVAVGRPHPEALVPASPRRDIASALRWHANPS